MRIVVLVKEVPDTYGERRLDTETGLADRQGTEAVLDEVSERALEVALTYADAVPGTQIVALTMAPETAAAALRKCLAMGATTAVHVADPELLGADLTLTAQALAAALRRTPFDLVLAGNASTDGAGGVLPAMVAEHLGVPQLTNLRSLHIEEGAVSGTRTGDGGEAEVSSPLPAVVSVTEALPEARFPNFKGILAAKKKPLETMALADLDVDPLDPRAARSIMIAVQQRPPRQAGIKIDDGSDAADQLAEFLVSNRLA